MVKASFGYDWIMVKDSPLSDVIQRGRRGQEYRGDLKRKLRKIKSKLKRKEKKKNGDSEAACECPKGGQ